MKIGDRKDELQQDALRILETNSKGGGAVRKKKDIFGRDVSEEGGVELDIALGKSIGDALDPTALLAERRAKVEEIKRRVQAGTYVLPPSEEIAKRLVEEINFEILTGSPDNETDNVE